ncbi:AraC family transcriptional regulator [Jiangella rhizosphaerae]|uniref:AraC family transcriptional regulator n=2 Tax=Jiangella rhizosphaerae TaxID=2293569 RepID=A0A418KN52_9ACTN|nr:AraC family transcriptional regulator [Jiangella rhizosphaerae]
MWARYVRHAFAPHSHPTFAIGVVERGLERLRIGDRTEYVGPGGLVLLNPGQVHTGAAATAGGWTYRVLYPSTGLLAEATGAAAPWFGRSVVDDREAAEAVLAAHRAAEEGDALTSSTLLLTTLAGLGSRHGGVRREHAARRRAGARQAAAARDVLESRLVDPPSLDELAGLVGIGRFALMRAFRRRYGLPPHAYLTQQRVRRACALLETGHPPAAVAVAVGFADQAHLTRHFRRMIGVPPGQYRRKNVQDR